MKTVKFYTLGCKVNQYETQCIREKFIRAGFRELDGRQLADLYVINTCTVTHRADSGSFSLMRKAKRENPRAKIIVTGCLAELDEPKIRKKNGASLILKNKDKLNILEHLSYSLHPDYRFLKKEHNHPGLKTPLYEKGISYFKGHTRVFLKIQDGCSNRCAFCKVPLVRGISQSKPLNEIAQEAEQLVKNGVKEIVLCGICLGSYGKDLYPKLDLVDAIGVLGKIDGLLRLRLSSIEVADVSDQLIKTISESKTLCRHLHIPLQSGDDEILRKMNRNYRRSDYLQLINKIRKQIPEIAITTDILVGFPTEEAHNFRNTIELVKQVSLLKVHIFPYSRREGTPAFDLQDKLSPLEIKQRISDLKNVSQRYSFAYRSQFLNKNMDVLFEGSCKKDPNLWIGHTDNYIKVTLKSKRDLKNQLITVKLNKIDKDSVRADFS